MSHEPEHGLSALLVSKVIYKVGAVFGVSGRRQSRRREWKNGVIAGGQQG